MRKENESQAKYVERLQKQFNLSDEAITRLGVAFVGLLEGEFTMEAYNEMTENQDIYAILSGIGFNIDEKRTTILGRGQKVVEYSPGLITGFIRNIMKTPSNYP